VTRTPPPPHTFLNLSGYTLLNERMNTLHHGRGAEHVANAINKYFQMMVRLIFANGGDLIKFAGDAAIVVWPLATEHLGVRCLRALHCAFDIQAWLKDFVVDGSGGGSGGGGGGADESMRLAVKVGIGVGGCTVVHLGGVLGRIEYVALGEGLTQVSSCSSRTVVHE